MDPLRWQQVEELYHAALESEPGERGALLSRADPELRREVESLLAQESGATPLNQPAWEGAASLLGSTVTVLTPGTQLGPYKIEGPLAAGGMGEVFRGVDTRLGRAVAIKTSQEKFSARFDREARAISSLNHPNICTLHDVGPNYLVMELCEGETLAARLKRGKLSIQEALRYGAQIADALAAAHAKGITHRDLKPGNIMLGKAGIKVLDFGLAKSPHDLTLTGTRMVMGTPAYMAPEQREGKECDARSDIFSFGLVLYEMAMGKRAEPGQMPLLDQLPERLRHVIERCLEQDPDERWQTASDVRKELQWAATSRADAPSASPISGITFPQRRNLIPWGVTGAAALASALLAVSWWRATRPAEYPLTRLSVDLGPDALEGRDLTAAISPDGRRLVFPARTPDGKQQLATRLLDQTQATPLLGTDNGRYPFFSPDSQWVGFFADRKLKKISVQGGAPVVLCDAPFSYGASWGEDGTITAAPNLVTGLYRVPAAGGSPQPLTKLGKGEVTHRWPQVLPGGEAIIFTASPTNIGMENASIEAISLKSGATKTLVTGGYFGRYLAANGTGGYLVYMHQDVLLGVAFDLNSLEIQGTPTPLLEDLAVSQYQNGGGQFDFSPAPSGHGTLVYLAGKVTPESWPVAWLDSSGKMQPLTGTPGFYSQPRFSPDGRRLALTMRTSSGTDIYVYELGRGTMTRITVGGHAQGPVWSPDGRHIAFQWSASGFGIGWVRSDGSLEPQKILTAQNMTSPYSFSPDGRRLAYYENNPETSFDISTVALAASDTDDPKPSKPELFLETPSQELAPMFSPDGRWIAYRSNESGTDEIYVRAFPGGREGKWQISTGGGMYTMWSNNARELFYETTDNHIMVVAYTVNGDSFIPGKPRLWSENRIFMPGNTNLTLAPDGKRFAVFPIPEAARPEKGSVHVTFLLNFLDELRRKVPTGK